MRMRSWIAGVIVAGLFVSAFGCSLRPGSDRDVAQLQVEPAGPLSAGGPLEKKLINFGWDMRTPFELARTIGELQHLPFDGLTIRARGTAEGWDDKSRATNYCYTFYNKDVDPAPVEAHVEAMSRIKWGKFTDNFMYVVTGDNVDWFDEAAWDDEDGYILKNVRAIARMGRAGKCKGILFEPEFIYWGQPGDPWKYQTQASRKEKSIAEYRAMVRQRGRQFIDAIESEMRNPVFLTCFWGITYSPVAKIAMATDPKMVDKIIAEAPHYGLLHDFMLGVLEGADKGTVIVDGNESSYYTSDWNGYNSAYHFVHQTMLGAIPEELRYKYRAQVRMGHAVYADVHSNTRGQAYPSTFMTPEERALAMEWVVYHALKNSDKYVWFYTEKPQYLAGVRVAPEMPPAIDRARRKVAANEKIGFDYLPLRNRAGRAYNQAMFGAVKPSKAEIVRAVGRPKIDGKLDDNVWKKASQLGPFQKFRTATHPLETKTMGYMAYDEANLYIGIRVDDPEMPKSHSVQVGIAADEAASKYYEIRLTSDNERWDSLTPASVWPHEISGKDESWNGKYETATHVDEKFWSAEMAIPWAALNRRAPRPGEEIKGNLIQRNGRRESHGNAELSSWSLMVRRRLIEAKTFGTWEFK